MNDAQRQKLHLMGIQTYVQRDAPMPGGALARAPTVAAKARREAPAVAPAAMDWETLERTVAGCRACPLHESRTQTVFGTGDRAADWLIVGEAPGAEEDARGEPFVGRAGRLLTSMLRAAGFAREEVYIANVLKCRPPNNRDPGQKEADQCLPYLARQIQLIEPRIILAVGRIAAHRILNTDLPLGRLRGRVHEYDDGQRRVPVVVTYHPAYLLRSPSQKRRAWEDLLFAQRTARESGA